LKKNIWRIKKLCRNLHHRTTAK